MANNSNYSILSGSAGKGETSLSIDIPYPVENNNFIVWLILPTGQVVQGSGSYNNGRISITNKIDTSDEWGAIVYRAETAVLNATLKSSGEVSLSDIIAQFRKNVRVLEQLETLVKTSVRAVDEIVPLPNATKRAGKFLSFDAAGNPVANIATETLEKTLTKAEDYADIADNAASASSDYADLSLKYKTGAETAKAEARAWAVGDAVYEDTIDNNAKYYAESAKEAVAGFDGKVDEATRDFNNNYEDKKGEINQIASDVNSKVNGFDSKVDEATRDFNSNALTKTTEFNYNARLETDAFDSNAKAKTDAFNSNASSKLTQFNDNADGVLSQAKSYANEVKNTRDETVEIVDPEGWRTGTRAMISSLAVAKANRGEFWFNGGALTTTNKMPLNTPFSCVWTMSMTQEEFVQHKTYFPKIIGNIGYWATASYGYGWSINRIGDTLIGIGANNATDSSSKYNTLDVLNYLDGNPHIWTVVYNGTTISLYIDNVKKTSITFTFENDEASNLLGIGSTPTSDYPNYGVWGKIYRIKYFNFDMSADDAPYTIADYISGKDESPLLYGSQPVFNWTNSTGATLESIGVLVEDNRVVLTNTDEVHIYPFAVGAFKKGYTYRIKTSGSIVSSQSMRLICPMSKFKLIRKNIITGEITDASASGSITAYLFLANGNDWETELEFTATEDSTKQNTYLRISAVDTSATNSFTMSAENIGALLSLEDVKSGVQILDKSGNANNANISGTVYASKENNPARCVDSASFSWAGTATTQKFANSDVAIPANSKVVAYAKASVGMSASFTCGSNSAVSKELSANTLTEIGSFLNASQGAFKVAPSSATTGKMEAYLTIEKF